MLTRALSVSSRVPLAQAARRSIITVPNKNWLEPESTNDLIKYLDSKRPTYTCLYFHASWNPMCAEIETDYDNFTSNNAGFTHIKVDCDKTPKLKFYFDARVEPQFLLLLNGSEVKRQIGFNFNLVDSQLEEVRDFHMRSNNYMGDTGNQWERFYDSFDRWQKDGEYDRDAMRMMVDSQADTHRGPGTQNP